ncbi:MAG: indole-3-glycerol phosphate synthase TrpC [Rhodobacteraceae bacterium]|nr:indole-3-glycerol phosphate synthase TrpC [Paracoccaceae bacterium]
MTSILQKIHDYKLEEVNQLKSQVGLHELEIIAQSVKKPRGFATALQIQSALSYAIIAEIKKASPSKGLIRDKFDPIELAQSYCNGGAACLSVLTDRPSFQGNNDFLRQAANTVSLPILRKDFMIDPIQVVESRAIGADCILIIMGLVDDQLAAELEQTAIDHGMDVLIEVHNEDEINRATQLRSNLIGINNRNLKTFEVRLDTTKRLMKYLPKEKVVVSESGIFTQSDLDYLAEGGIKCFLVGESLMRKQNVQKALETLLGISSEAIAI